MMKHKKSFLRSVLALAMVLLACAAMPPVSAEESRLVVPPRPEYSNDYSALSGSRLPSNIFESSNIYGGELIIPKGKSQFLKVKKTYKEVAIGDPTIADINALSDRSLYILGKKIGSTNLTLRDSDGDVITVIDVNVSHDIDGLKAKMSELAPGDNIEVRAAGGSVVLSGRVASADRLRSLMAVAEQYTGGAVTNMLSIGGSQQVLLKVRFAEVQRSILKDLGFNHLFQATPDNDLFEIATGVGVNAQAATQSGFNIVGSDFSLTTLIDALERKGMVRTLAEPNIIALSGDSASFLAGGEFPIPVAQDTEEGGSTVTVEFKEFGVGLAFTPTVIGKHMINLVLDTEVSSIDPSVSVTTSDIAVPGLKVRRANTTVELSDGQSFAIAGLIEDNFEDTIDAIPGITNIPILGPLSRSTDFLRRQTELVVIIQAHLVEPTVDSALAVPTDKTLPPTEFDLFMLGKISKHNALDKAGGIDGPYGYILP